MTFKTLNSVNLCFDVVTVLIPGSHTYMFTDWSVHTAHGCGLTVTYRNAMGYFCCAVTSWIKATAHCLH